MHLPRAAPLAHGLVLPELAGPANSWLGQPHTVALSDSCDARCCVRASSPDGTAVLTANEMQVREMTVEQLLRCREAGTECPVLVDCRNADEQEVRCGVPVRHRPVLPPMLGASCFYKAGTGKGAKIAVIKLLQRCSYQADVIVHAAH